MQTQPSSATLSALLRHESPNVTYLDPDGTWPIVWQKAKGMHVWDESGRRYLDLTAAFGVAACGHAPREVVRAGQQQMGCLMHAMGDVHPHALKGRLLAELSRWTFERWARRDARRGGVQVGKVAKSILCNSGFEAVEASLKTAHLATGRSGVIAFSGAYHGLGYGALTVTHRSHFRRPFQSQLKKFSHFLKYPSDAVAMRQGFDQLERLLKKGVVGAVIVEAIQSRAGLRIPPQGFLLGLQERCHAHGALLILDEIYTGFGRTGMWFACEHESVTPDLICVGKALTGGFPLSACVGHSELMDQAWPRSSGEAMHTSTFLGHPVGCAMALAQLELLKSRDLARASSRQGKCWIQQLSQHFQAMSDRVKVRGRGLMIGLELIDAKGSPDGLQVVEWAKRLLKEGVIVLPSGERGEVLSLSPPLIIGESHMKQATNKLLKTYHQLIKS